MTNAANSYFSRNLLILFIGCLTGLIITVDPYLSTLSLNMIGVYIPYGFSLLIIIVSVAAFVLIVLLIKMIKSHKEAITFIILYTISLQVVGLSPLSKIDAKEVILLTFIIIFFISSMVEQKNIKITLLDILNLCFLSALILSVINGGISSFIQIITFVMAMAVCFLIINSCTDSNLLRQQVKWLIIVTSISAIIGVLQEVVYLSSGIPLIGNIADEQRRFMFQDISLGRVLRVPALTDTYMLFAYFLTSVIMINLNILLYWPLNRRRKTLLSITFGLMFIALILTFSRMSLLAFFILIPIVFIVRWPKYALHMTAGFILLVIGIYLAGYYKDIYDTVLHEVSFGESRVRIALDRKGLYGFIYQHPWIGIGAAKGAKYTAHIYNWPAHNVFILVAGETGLLGLIFYCLIIFYSLIKTISINIRIRNPIDKGITRGLLFSFLAVLIIMQFDVTYVNTYLWFLMGIIKAADLIYTNRERDIVF
ncbi:MAG TPA: O-antigen ligase domain-containing protein [Nitrospirae bacterium]|nr:O-antigen ligase domain-containing protein [Nitrospirota bacterium]